MKQRAVLLLLLLAGCRKPDLRVAASKTTLLADGYDHIIFRIDGISKAPQIEVSGNRLFCRLQAAHEMGMYWEAQLGAGVLPGTVRVRISSAGRHFDQSIVLLPEISDSAADGTPDFLRLEDESDRASFKRWLTYLAELQYFIAPRSRTPEIIDCSSLVRYCYREALRNHDAAWISEAKLPLVEADSSIKKYSYPHTLLGSTLFRIRSGSYSPADLADHTFAEFADAKTLQRFNTFFVSRDINRAQAGDILFYRRETIKGVSYHSMIFIGPSKVKPDAEIYVVYHTGPDGTSYGEMRRLTITQLLHFPNSQWQPIAANELFLGVYRWNILKVTS